MQLLIEKGMSAFIGEKVVTAMSLASLVLMAPKGVLNLDQLLMARICQNAEDRRVIFKIHQIALLTGAGA